MAIIQRVKKASTRKGKRVLIDKESKLIENTKTGIFLRGLKCSDTAMKCLKDFSSMKKPHAIFFGKKHDFKPFENVGELEDICKKYDASLFAFASHNKKRPHNLVLGRMFDHKLLDMLELGINDFRGFAEFANSKFTVGSKPCIIFAGEPFLDENSDYQKIKNLLVDFFHGEEITNIRVEGIEHVISFVAMENLIYMSVHKIVMKRSEEGNNEPDVELEEIGPSLKLSVRRNNLASQDFFKSACKQPKQLKPKKVKNITKDNFGSKLGRIHMSKQNLRTLKTKKSRALRKTKMEAKVEKATKVRERKAPEKQKRHTNPNKQPLGSH